MQHIVAIDMHLMPQTKDRTIPPSMVYIVRRGLSNRVDLGVQVSETPQLDLKINAVRAEYFDLALGPALSAMFLAGAGISGTLPVIIGLNLGPRVTLVAQGGAGFITNTGVTFYLFFGGGLQIRATEWLAIQPEVSAQLYEWSYGPDPVVNVGLGFGFGAQPQYGPAEGGKPQ